MTETAKERIYREAFEEIKKVCDTQDHVDNDLLRFFITKKMMEIENLPVTTDKLSVEKLQKIRVEELKDFNSKILQAELKNQNLQERLNTAKKYIEHVIGTIKHDGHLGTIQTDWILPDLEKALAAIGGSDDE